MSSVEKAFTPVQVGSKVLKNRIVMAPMTRNRADNPGALPTELMALYYAQRASAGLIVTEGTQPSIVGQGYPNTPGLHSSEQVDAWRRVTEAVHAAGGVIFAQIMHSGRISHSDLHDGELMPLAPSAVAAEGQVFTTKGMQDFQVPVAMTEEDIHQTIEDFRHAAQNAIAAGFDGVEIHGANGYLLHQFLSDNANLRTDEWGATVEGHIKFVVEVTRAVVEAVGADHVGIRLSPANPFNSISESNIEATYTQLVSELATLNLAYLHFMENPMQNGLIKKIRDLWTNPLIINTFVADRSKGRNDLESIEDGFADLVSFGQLFLANPDLPARLENDGPYNVADPATFYGGGAEGYTDYPTLN
ncbi:MAG: alkene reductase [Acidimicrobiaceae bacterium]|nr:alkene reductase [Acidimicrobiaceae bacterium]